MNFNEKFGIPKSVEFLKKPLIKDQVFCEWAWFPCAYCGKNTPWSCLLRDSDGLISVHVCSEECIAAFTSQGAVVEKYDESSETQPEACAKPEIPEPTVAKTREEAEAWLLQTAEPEPETSVLACDRDPPALTAPEPAPTPAPKATVSIPYAPESITIVKDGKAVAVKMDDTLLKMLARRK